MAESTGSVVVDSELPAVINKTSNALMDMSNSLNSAYTMVGMLGTKMGNMFQATSTSQIIDATYTVVEKMNDVANAVEETNKELEKEEEQAKKNASVVSLLSNTYKKVANVVKTIGLEKLLNESDKMVRTMQRLETMAGGTQNAQEIYDTIYASAQRARTPVTDTINAFAELKSAAGAKFSGDMEMIAFMEQVNKQCALGGASATEQAGAISQLTQAMASGSLKGTQLNTILEAAPGIGKAIEQSMGWAEGSIQSYAAKGVVTASVVKNALLGMASETNTSFETLPLTFGQVMTSLQNDAAKAFQPVLLKLNEIGNSTGFQGLMNGARFALAVIATAAMGIFDMINTIVTVIADNWSWISPILYGVMTALAMYVGYLAVVQAAELAYSVVKGIASLGEIAYAVLLGKTSDKLEKARKSQNKYNYALLSSPVMWIALIILGVIVAIISFCSHLTKAQDVASSWAGVLCGGINVVIQWFFNLLKAVANVANGLWSVICAIGTNIGIFVGNVVAGIQERFWSLLATVLQVGAGISEILNTVFQIEIDTDSIMAKANEFAEKATAADTSKREYRNIEDAFAEGASKYKTFQDGWQDEAYTAGAAWGDQKWEKISDGLDGLTSMFDTSDLLGEGYEYVPENIEAMSDNTSAIVDSVDISSENLKYLRDIAERDVVNRFTTAEIRVDMQNHNTINSSMDIDGVVSLLVTGVNQAMEQSAEGVYA